MSNPVVVTWLDAERGDETWEATSIGVVRNTVGWVVRKDADGIVIAMSRDEYPGTQKYERWFAIPTAYIQRVRKLT